MEPLLTNKILEERLSTLIFNLHEAVLVENEDRKIILTNLAFCKMFGIQATPEQMIGADCANAAEESKGFFKDPVVFVQRINQLLEEKKTVIGDQLETIYNTYLERDYIPVYVDNVYKGHMWKYRDITEKESLLKKVQQQKEDLKELAYILSHDLKAPLRAITNLAEWANEDIQEKNYDELYDKLEKLNQRAKLASELVDGIVQYSSIGNKTIELEDITLEEICKDLSTTFNSNQLELNFDLQIDKIHGAKIYLFRLLSNLISNSIKYNDKSICKINIAFSSRTIIIEDNGPGILASDHGKIFNLFETLGANKQSSSGIGLAIVKKIIDFHRWNIEIDKDFTDGLRITISF